MADIAIFRINYKSDFILTLNSDAGWTTPFCIKFWTGAPSQAYYAYYDGTTYTHCAPVEGEPTKLLVQFDDHHLPIGDLKFQIGYHFTVADFPTSMEDEVLNQASVIIEQDGEPAQVMLDFTGETAPEIQFSLPAYANEAQRIANEEQRIAHEAIRIVNEESRIAAETIRQQNEAQRISNEESRVAEFAQLKQESETATADANAAATLANEKAQLAADKAALAGAAATLANAKAQLAADKAALADDAATLANDKAALAQQKAEYAQTQGDYAKAQGNYAKEQGEIAEEDHERAEADHTRAESDHATAGSDHTQAGTDHSTAVNDHAKSVTDHNQADTDHTRAESDHTRATSDHTQAGADHTTAQSDHGIAADDHTQAGNDHTRAESDHTRAESDHAAVEVYVDSLGAFDISAYHATGGVLAEYADLAAALGTNGANIPDALRKGGMSVKFAQSSDNKYVQARCMAQNFTTDVTQWQGVDDEPTAGSDNLVKSGGVFKFLFNKFIKGADMTYVEVPTYGLIPNHTYYLFIKDTNWTLPSDMPEIGLNKLAIDSVYNGVKTAIRSWWKNYTLPQPIPFTVPQNSDYILVGGRAAVGTNIEFYISNVNPQDIQDDIKDLRQDVYYPVDILKYRYVQGSIYVGVFSPGNTKCISTSDYIGIGVKSYITVINERQQDNNYWKVRVSFFNKNKDFLKQFGYEFIEGETKYPIPDGTRYVRFSISLYNGATGEDMDCTPSDIPSDGTEIIYINTVSQSVEEQVTKLYNRDFNKVIIGADMTYVEVPTYGLIPGHTYYLFIKDTNWALPSGMADSQNKLAIDSVYNGSKTALRSFGKNSVVSQPVIFTMPANTDYILVCGRAAIGTNIEFYISDVNPQDVVALNGLNAPMPLNRMLGYGMNLLFSVTSGYGDAACYNNLIFQFIHGNQYVYVHDASNGTLIQTITMPNPDSGYHNNSVSFGSEKYDVNDDFPLLYASQESSAQNKCIVYRITGSQGSYEMTVVQTITYPTNAQTGINYHNCYIDTKNNYLLLGGLVNYPYSATDGNTLQYMAFELPVLSDGDVTLQMADMLFKSGQFTKMPTTQGGFCKNGYLYQVFGVSGPHLLMVYDIKNCRYCYIYNISEEAYNNEPEGAFDYNNAIHVVFNGGRVYKFGIAGLL